MAETDDAKDHLIAELRDQVRALREELERERAKQSLLGAGPGASQGVVNNLANLLQSSGAEQLEKQRRKKRIDEGLHFLSEGRRLFLELHTTISAEEKTRRIDCLAELDANLRSLMEELDA
jgi:hypothetical protein